MLNQSDFFKHKPVICVFAKPPVAGQVKTRLIDTCGAEPSKQLAEAFLQDTIDSLRQLEWAEVVIATTFPHGPQMETLANGIEFVDQGDGDLGARIERVMALLLQRSPYVIAMGADTPGLPQDRLEAARKLLTTHDSVIGPAEDGGFYLLGLKRCPSNLLRGLPWGAPETYQRTTDRLRTRGFSFIALKPWFDVDRPEDVKALFELIEKGVISAPASQRIIKRLALRGDV